MVDYHEVFARHEEIDGRLINWAAWCRSSKSSRPQPMFRFYRPDKYGAGVSSTVDVLDAAKVQKAFTCLSELQRHCIAWAYQSRAMPGRLCKALRVDKQELMRNVHAGRDELICLLFKSAILRTSKAHTQFDTSRAEV